jgi:hypothetical protein
LSSAPSGMIRAGGSTHRTGTMSAYCEHRRNRRRA